MHQLTLRLMLVVGLAACFSCSSRPTGMDSDGQLDVSVYGMALPEETTSSWSGSTKSMMMRSAMSGEGMASGKLMMLGDVPMLAAMFDDVDSAEAKRIEGLVDGLLDAVNARDLDGVMSYYDPRLVSLFTPGVPEIRGYDVVRDFYEKRLAAGTASLRVLHLDTGVYDDWAFNYGEIVGTFTPNGAEEALPVHDDYVIIFERPRRRVESRHRHLEETRNAVGRSRGGTHSPLEPRPAPSVRRLPACSRRIPH